MFGKALIIALCAAIAAWLPVAMLFAFAAGMGVDDLQAVLIRFFSFAALGSFAVGLPVALLTFQLAGHQLASKMSNVFVAANLGGVMLLLVTALLGETFGALFYGLPCVIAANIYALLGWFWILKPMREASS